MTDNWQPGDVALCVKLSFERVLPTDRDPRSGSIHVVRRVVRRGNQVGLVFAEFRYAYAATCFRRIAPLTEGERRAALADFSNFHRTGDGK